MSYWDEEAGDTKETESNMVYIPFVPIATATVTMDVANKSADPNGFAPGETIVFGVTVTNSTTYSHIDDVRLFMTLDATNAPPWKVIDSLDQGESVYLEYEYVPSKAQCEKGKLVNKVAATWKSVDSIAPAGDVAYADLCIPAAASDHCSVAFAAGDNGALTAKIDACADHAALLAETAAAQDEESLRRAEDTWLREADALYAGMEEKADGAAAEALRAEREAWSSRHEALRALLPYLTDDPAEAARLLLDDAMLRCAEACGEAGGGGAPSRDPGLPDAPAAEGGRCAYTAAIEGNGFTMTARPCGRHAAPAADGAGGLFGSLPEGGARQADAFTSAFAEWTAARKAYLTALYGEDAAAALLEEEAALSLSMLCAVIG